MDQMATDMANGKFKESMNPDKAMKSIMDSLMTDIEEMQTKMKVMSKMMETMKGHKGA